MLIVDSRFRSVGNDERREAVIYCDWCFLNSLCGSDG